MEGKVGVGSNGAELDSSSRSVIEGNSGSELDAKGTRSTWSELDTSSVETIENVGEVVVRN